MSQAVITSLTKEVIFLVAFVSFVCLSVCYQHYSKSSLFAMKCYGEVHGGARDNSLDFGSDLDTHWVYKRILLNF